MIVYIVQENTHIVTDTVLWEGYTNAIFKLHNNCITSILYLAVNICTI